MVVKVSKIQVKKGHKKQIEKKKIKVKSTLKWVLLNNLICSCSCVDTHLSSTAEASHSVTLAQVVEARLGELCGGDDGERPVVEGVKAVLLSAHAGVVACWSLVGHVFHSSGAKRAGGRWSREAHV